MRFSANLTGVFVLYITLPNVQNEDPFKIVLKSLSKGSHMILDRSRNKEHIDLQLSTNLTGVFVLYITLPNVQNEDPFKIVFKISQAFSVSHGWPVSAVGRAWLAQSAEHGAKVVSSILTRTTKITFFPFHVKEFYFKKWTILREINFSHQTWTESDGSLLFIQKQIITEVHN